MPYTQSLADLYKQLPTMEPSALTNEDLAQMPFDHLAMLRGRFTDQQSQNRFAPYEHRAYAREVAGQNPLMAPLLAAAAPAYQAVKMVEPAGLSRSQPSFEQLKQGWLGTGEGLLAGIRSLYQRTQ